MNGRDEELLSALHDGELAGDERDSAERVAAEAGAREVLDDYAEISSCLRSLPSLPAPVELRDAVMQRVRAAIPAQVAPAPAVHRPARRNVWRWSATAAAAVGVIGVILVINRPQGARLGNAVA